MRKKSSKKTTSPKTIKIDGSTFTKAACSKRKTDAKKKAEKIRKDGHKARVIQNDKGYCVYKGSRRKKPGKRA